METTKTQTVGQWLEELASSNQSSDLDSSKMANLLHRVGFPQAVVIVGIVYLEGKGTIDAPPMSIHAIAKMIVDKAQKHS